MLTMQRGKDYFKRKRSKRITFYQGECGKLKSLEEKMACLLHVVKCLLHPEPLLYNE